MLFIDFSCLGQQYIYEQDKYWRSLWLNIAGNYPNIPMKLVAGEVEISIPDLPANCELLTFRINKLSGLFSGGKAFANALKPYMNDKNAVWITNQITHIHEGDLQQILWVEDLEWLKFPLWQMQSRDKIDRKDWQKKAKFLKHFISISKHYTDVLKNELTIPETCIHINPFFYIPEIKPVSWADKESIKTQYSGGNDYFVFAGDIHNRHNIIPLLKAYSIFKKWQKSSMQLVILGNTTEYSPAILQAIDSYKHRNDVVIITDADEREKLKLISGAYACIYTAESISLPVTMLDAMKAGVPLIVSDLPNMMEWGLDHVLYANSKNETQIAEKMILLYKNETLRNQLVENAMNFAARISDDKSADSLLAVLHSLFPANFAATIK